MIKLFQIAKLLQLISFCINNFPEAISNISKDDEDFLLFSFTSLLDLLNFLDQDEFFMTMQDNFELLLKILSLLQNYHSILMDPSKILAFWIEFIDRIEGEQQFWSLFELEKAFLEILQTKTHPLVIEKVIECVSLMIISANNGSKELFRIFNEVILNCFSSNNLQVFKNHPFLI